MQVPYVVPVCLHVLVDDVRRDGANLDKAVVLDKDGVAVQVAVDDGRAARLVQITERAISIGLGKIKALIFRAYFVTSKLTISACTISSRTEVGSSGCSSLCASGTASGSPTTCTR